MTSPNFIYWWGGLTIAALIIAPLAIYFWSRRHIL